MHVKKLSPFSSQSRIGQVAGYEHRIQRLRGMYFDQFGEDFRQSLIALRAGATALNTISISLADGMDVRQMRNAPSPIVGGR